MSRTVNEIEERLSPAHLKQQVAGLKDSVLGNYHEAKDHLKEDLTRELRGAKDKVQGEIHHARMAVREATVGRVEHMVHDARETVTDAGTTVLDTIKANPVPTALVALGLGWLLMRGQSSTRSAGRRRYGPRYLMEGEYEPSRRTMAESQRIGGLPRSTHGADAIGEGVSNLGHRVKEGASHLAGQASEVAHQVGDKAGEVAHDVGEKVEHLAHEAVSGATHLADDARIRGGQMVRSAGRQVQRAERTVENTLRANPLAVGAIALALGAAIGLVLPHTRKEDEWMGRTKERLLHRAEDMAEGAIHKVEDEVSEKIGAAGLSAEASINNDVSAQNGISNGMTSSSRNVPKTSSP